MGERSDISEEGTAVAGINKTQLSFLKIDSTARELLLLPLPYNAPVALIVLVPVYWYGALTVNVLDFPSHRYSPLFPFFPFR
jgi:hypothetical protein